MQTLDVEGVTVYVSCREFLTPADAKAAWERTEKHFHGRNVGIGVFRHGYPETGGIFVSLVSLDESVLQEAVGISGGAEHRLGDEEWRPLVFRHVLAYTKGSHRIRRGRRGAFLLPDGTMQERVGGDA